MYPVPYTHHAHRCVALISLLPCPPVPCTLYHVPSQVCRLDLTAALPSCTLYPVPSPHAHRCVALISLLPCPPGGQCHEVGQLGCATRHSCSFQLGAPADPMPPPPPLKIWEKATVTRSSSPGAQIEGSNPHSHPLLKKTLSLE